MITFDVDSVLLQTEEKIIREIKRIYNKEITLMDITYWNYYKDYYPEVMKALEDINFYNDIKPINEMYITLEKIIERYGYKNIKFVTSSNNILQEQKEICLNRHFGNIKNFNKIEIIHVGLFLNQTDTHHEKYHYTKDTVLIDDAIHNIEPHVYINNKEAILVDFGYGWNQNFDHSMVTRISKQKEIITTLDIYLQ